MSPKIVHFGQNRFSIALAMVTENVVRLAIAAASPGDNFSKKMSNRILTSRMETGKSRMVADFALDSILDYDGRDIDFLHHVFHPSVRRLRDKLDGHRGRRNVDDIFNQVYLAIEDAIEELCSTQENTPRQKRDRLGPGDAGEHPAVPTFKKARCNGGCKHEAAIAAPEPVEAPVIVGSPVN